MSKPSDPPRRFLYLWLDRLPTDRVRRLQSASRTNARTGQEGHLPQRPLALVAKQASAVRLQALDATAEALGLSVGLLLTSARALVPELETAEADPTADRAILAAIGEACRRYTPALAVDPPDGVYLNITGAGPLLGGEDALIVDLTGRLKAQGFTVRHGLADTPGLAWALAHFGAAFDVGPVAAPGVREAALAPLPMAALRLEEEALAVLKGLGLRRIGQLMERSRPALARRLGEAFLERLDDALGVRPCALALELEISPYEVEQRLAEPVAFEDQVLRLIRGLAERLIQRLETERLGAERFVLELFRVNGKVKRLEVAGSQPLRHPDRIAALFAGRIAVLKDGLDADFGFDHLRLSAASTGRLSASVQDLLHAKAEAEAEGEGDDDYAGLVDRLTARLGRGVVKQLAPAPQTRVPEQAVRALPFEAGAGPAWADAVSALDHQAPLRPLTLFSPPHPIEVIAVAPEGVPEQFRWRRLHHRIAAAEGPERLEPEWGRTTETGLVRDYYRLEDEEGRRYWVFREGRFGEPDAPAPRWFLHGLLP